MEVIRSRQNEIVKRIAALASDGKARREAGEFLCDGEKLLREALAQLTDKEKTIVTLRFGLGGGREKTQKEVADLLGISQSYISRLEKRIIQRLKKELLRLS